MFGILCIYIPLNSPTETFINIHHQTVVMIDVVMNAGRTGSNPGGKASILMPGKASIDVYLKYCNNTKVGRETHLTAEHQPVYEALVAAMARQFGLATPETTILKNEEDVNFIYLSSFSDKELNSRKPFYFTSRLLTEPESKDTAKAVELLKNDKMYRDLLILADVSGRRQNVYYPQALDNSKVIYLDLGCSFTDCHNGEITQRNVVKKLDLERKAVLKNRRFLDRLSVENASGILVNLGEMVESVPSVGIQIYGKKSERLDGLLGPEEVDYIKSVFTAHMASEIGEYKLDSRVRRRD